ncbi:MAG: Rho termination factor N-terminal domain-containing protein [Pseudomonadota bacterium]
MNFNEVRRMAKDLGINTAKMKKTDVIRAIQRAENNIDCYATGRVNDCYELLCLWKSECLSKNNKEKIVLK